MASSYDIIVVGAGLAGINCAYRLQTQLPSARFTVLDARDDIGGTWELFRYPGIRSDSDLHTYGFAWAPWPHENPIAEGDLIMSYLRRCCDEHDLRRHMQFRQRVAGADWDGETRRWTLTVVDGGAEEKKKKKKTRTLEASFVVLGTGFFDYETPLPAVIPGLERFRGDVIHPQFWPADYDYAGKDMVVIGSGATAITLVPNLAPRAKHVTMLQRSPTYIFSTDSLGPFDKGWASRVLLPRAARRWLNWLFFAIVPFYRVNFCWRYPALARKAMLKSMGAQLPADVSADPHFTPRYDPWEQRLCLCPGGDFFRCLHGGREGEPAKAGVVTSTIETVTEDGIVCGDGQTLKADVIVTATGLKMQWGGGIPLRVDGELVSPPEHVIWDGCMMSDVPNLMYMVGYPWASWTVGVDNTAIMLCRLWKEMQRKGDTVAVPRLSRDVASIGEEERQSWFLLTSTWAKRDSSFPFNLKNGTGPWKARGNVWFDWWHARFGNIRKALALS